MQNTLRCVLLSLLLSFSLSLNRVCLNPEGNEVDWYAIFLYPQNSSKEGILSYGYFDASSTSLQYYAYTEETFPPNRVTKYTLSPDTDYNFFFWNDDKTCKDDTESKSASSSKAHAKGELIMDKDNGVFLQHSLPRFPTRMKNGEILTELPGNAGIYGQTFLCISVETKTSYEIAELLNYINVSNNLSVTKDRVNPTENEWIRKLIDNKYSTKYPLTKETVIKSKDGKDFTFFSKSHRQKDVPYDTTLRQKYGTSFFVRTWSRPSLSPMICEDKQLLNVLDVAFDNNKFTYGKDKEHSKWAVSASGNICCFGDVNHTDSQKNRGGHIVCFENENLAKEMRGAIVTSDLCPNKFLAFME